VSNGSSTSAAVPVPSDAAPAFPLAAVQPWWRSASASGRMWLSDTVALAVAGALAALGSEADAATNLKWSAFFGCVVVALLSSRGHYRRRLDPRHLDTLRTIVTLTTVAVAFTITLRVIVGDISVGAEQDARLWALATVLLASSRSYITLAARRSARLMEHGEPTLIIGAGKVGQLTAQRLRAHPELGLRPIGFLDKEPLGSEARVDLPVLGASWDFDDVVAEHGVRHVIVTFSTAPTDVLVRLLNRCEQRSLRTSFVPRFFEKTTERFSVDRLGGLPLVSPHPANPYGRLFALKYALDRIGAAIAIAIFSPLLVALALGVLISSGRPILYRQERIGRDGRRFEMLKFRSMRPAQDAEAVVVAQDSETAPGGVEGLDRRTRLGTFMRKTSLDELPQLFNVLRGEMSFVGPRPERPEYVDVFGRTIHRYGERHRVKSGITGWAQVNGLRGKTSVADRAEWDNYYIENWSLWFDFKILLQTVMAVVSPPDVE
jgi:exopolysaccharide biosynthesis polyprenyl glycosylphosphotransferase